MKAKGCNNADLISDLPVIVLHHVLSFLPSKDSIRTSVLSKKWSSIQKSFPSLVFELPICLYDEHTGMAPLNERRDEWLNFADRSLQHFVQNKLCIEKMDLDLFCIHENSIPLVNTWLPLALHSGVFCLSFNVGVRLVEDEDENGEDEDEDEDENGEDEDEDENGEDEDEDEDKVDHHYPLPETTFAVKSSLLYCFPKFFRLEKVTLSTVRISEEIVYDIIRNCPNLDDLNLLSIRGLKSLNISKPDKLLRLRVTVDRLCSDTKNVFVDALSLKFLDLSVPYLTSAIDLTSCCNLRELKLSYSDIDDDVFNHNIACLPLLEVLEISNSFSQRRIRISLQRLKHLFLRHCYSMECIEIDAPNLSIFELKLRSRILPVLVLGHVSRWSMFIDFNMKWTLGDFDSFWFFKIRAYLSLPIKDLTFHLSSDHHPLRFDIHELSFDLYDLRDVDIPPVVELPFLDLRDLVISNTSDWVTMLNGLLWSCHPKTFYVAMVTESCDWCDRMMILLELLNPGECQLCHRLPQCKCWRRRLYTCTVKVDEWELLEFQRRLEEGLVSNPEGCTIQVLFEWDNSKDEELETI